MPFSQGNRRLWLRTPGGSLTEQVVERRLGALNLGSVFCDVGAGLGFEVVAKVGLVLLSHFLRRRLLAMLGVRSVVLDAHFTDVEFGVACLADIETPQRQAQC